MSSTQGKKPPPTIRNMFHRGIEEAVYMLTVLDQRRCSMIELCDKIAMHR